MLELGNDVLVAAILNLVRSKKSVESTASDLLVTINNRVQPQDRPRDWPRGANRLSGEIRRLAPALRELGVSVDMDYRRKGDNNKLIKLWIEKPKPEPLQPDLI
jgi:hypothetical protein